MSNDLLDRPNPDDEGDDNEDDDDLELEDIPQQLMTEEEVLERMKNAPTTEQIYEHPNPDVRQIDQILRDVAWRNSVYADEILTKLPDNPYSEYVHTELSKHIAHIPSDGAKLLHSREYLDILLDYRNVLTEGDSENNTESENTEE